MRATRTSLAAIFAAMAVVAFESDADAQARRGESRQATSTSHSTSRSSNVTKTTPRSSKPSGTRVSPSVQTRKEQNPAVQKNDRKPSTTVTRPAGDRQSQQMRPSSPAKPSQQAKPSHPAKPSIPAKPSGKFEKRDDKPIAVTRPVRPTHRPDRPSHQPARSHPRERDFIVYSKPSRFWSSHNHLYGHKVKMLPSHVRRHVFNGVTYYCHNDIWYRPYGGYYVVCRPPFGTILAANLIADIAWKLVRIMDYRDNAARPVVLVNTLGLVQSQAFEGSTYYYQDGVFYTMDSRGDYEVIVPPAGALVEALPEDFETVVIDGEEYYKVDDTIYRVTVSEGIPYFEVLGQLYS